MRVLLDTQTVIMATHEEDYGKLSARVRRMMADSRTERFISSITVTEIAILSQLGRVRRFTPEEISQAARDLNADIIPYTPQHAYRLFSLPMHHRDPFDRMIIATAIAERIALVGGDRIFPKYKADGLEVVWQ